MASLIRMILDARSACDLMSTARACQLACVCRGGGDGDIKLCMSWRRRRRYQVGQFGDLASMCQYGENRTGL
jgi:hypothetical protein